uniref:hypothetical protein n=1 Tax=Streptomyces niveiscabiei TaxID=164115 RepID=UPI000AB87D8D
MADAVAGAELAQLAELYGVAPAFSPAPGRVVKASGTALVRVLAALGVDAGSPEAVREALRERRRPPARRA